MLPKIHLTRLTESAFDFACALESDSAARPYSEGPPPTQPELRQTFTDRLSSATNCDFLIRASVPGPPVGLAYIWRLNEPRREWEIAYIISAPHQNKGYGFAAAKALLQRGFEQLNAHRITATCNAANLASSRILQKAGMRREAIFVDKLFWNGAWTNQLLYAILEREYIRDGR
jgi:RimJ/RimL family protein N-acetyltransferase